MSSDNLEQLATELRDELNVDLQTIVSRLAYYFPTEKIIFRGSAGRWELEPQSSYEGAAQMITSWVPLIKPAQALQIVKSRCYEKFAGFALVPNVDAVVRYPDAPDRLYANQWVPPTLQSGAGEYPKLRRVLRWLTNGDAEAERWLTHWMARKIQNPAARPGVAPVFLGEEGSGKGTLYQALSQMLGPENCKAIGREDLETQYTLHFSAKLLVYADEIESSERLKSISAKLKMYITEPEYTSEAKYEGRHSVKNQAAWMFSSNKKTTPLLLSKGDRRYSVFANYSLLTPEHTAMVKSLYKSDNEPTSEFLAEVAALWHDLLRLDVDLAFCSTPFKNEARNTLIHAGSGSEELYIDELLAGRGPEWIEQSRGNLFNGYEPGKETWRFDGQGLASAAIYAGYEHFCKKNGYRNPLGSKTFFSSLGNYRGGVFSRRQITCPVTKRRVWCYTVPTAPVEDTTEDGALSPSTGGLDSTAVMC